MGHQVITRIKPSPGAKRGAVEDSDTMAAAEQATNPLEGYETTKDGQPVNTERVFNLIADALTDIIAEHEKRHHQFRNLAKQELEREPLSTFYAWSELVPTGWQTAVVSAAELAWGDHPEAQRLHETWSTLMDKVSDIEREHGIKFKIEEDFEYTATSRAIAFGAAFGFAMARTWPEGPEGLDGWSARAWEYAGLDRLPAFGEEAKESEPRPAA